jgi:predicted aspartyl protease
MGTFFTEALLAAPQQPDRRAPVNLLVDSGSTYTWVAATVLRELSVVPTERRRVVTIEGQLTEHDAAEVLITLEGRTLHTVCLFGGAGDLAVLGAYTLEGFGLTVDPVQRKLIPALQYGASAPFSGSRAWLAAAGLGPGRAP